MRVCSKDIQRLFVGFFSLSRVFPSPAVASPSAMRRLSSVPLPPPHLATSSSNVAVLGSFEDDWQARRNTISRAAAAAFPDDSWKERASEQLTEINQTMQQLASKVDHIEERLRGMHAKQQRHSGDAEAPELSPTSGSNKNSYWGGDGAAFGVPRGQTFRRKAAAAKDGPPHHDDSLPSDTILANDLSFTQPAPTNTFAIQTTKQQSPRSAAVLSVTDDQLSKSRKGLSRRKDMVTRDLDDAVEERKPSAAVGFAPTLPLRVASPTNAASDDDAERKSSVATSIATPRTRTLPPTQKPTSAPSTASVVVGLPEEHPFVTVMDLWYVVVTAVSCSIAVYSVSYRDEAQDPWTESTLLAVTFLCEASSAAFCVSRFFVMVRSDEWALEDSLASIRSHYLRGWFVFDLFQALPFEYIFYYIDRNIYNIILMRKFLRFARLVKLGTSGNPLLQTRLWLRFASVVGVFVVAIFICSCVFRLLEPNFNLIEALYWTVATTTTVGYGDIVPSKDNTRLFSVAVMIIGVVCMSMSTAFMTAFVTSKNPLQQEIDERKEKLHASMTFFRVPWTLQKEAIAALPNALEKHTMLEFKSIVEDMHPDIAKRLFMYSRVHVIRRFDIFAKAHDDTLLVIAERLKQRFATVGDDIIVAGEAGDEMYFVVWGAVVVFITGLTGEPQVLAVLKQGTFFGEVAVLTANCTRTANVTAYSSCELLELDRATVALAASLDDELGASLRAWAEKRRVDLDSKRRAEERAADARSQKVAAAQRSSPLNCSSSVGTVGVGGLEQSYGSTNPFSSTQSSHNPPAWPGASISPNEFYYSVRSQPSFDAMLSIVGGEPPATATTVARETGAAPQDGFHVVVPPEAAVPLALIREPQDVDDELSATSDGVDEDDEEEEGDEDEDDEEEVEEKEAEEQEGSDGDEDAPAARPLVQP